MNVQLDDNKMVTEFTYVNNRRIGMVVCVDRKYGIGMQSGIIPFRNKADMKNFKKLTIHSIVVMGRKTYESIGHPLPSRENVIISTTLPITYDGMRVFKCLDDCLKHFKRDTRSIYIIGGARLYDECISRRIPDRVYITQVDKDYGCEVCVDGLRDISKCYTSIVNEEVFNVNQELVKYADSSWSYSEYVKSMESS